jgi:hypothetical protein
VAVVGVVGLTAGCTGQEPPSIGEAEGSPIVTATPEPVEKTQGDPPIRRLKLSEVREAAAADGRIDRREAVRLATRWRTRPLAQLAARKRGDEWRVRVVDGDGCRFVLRLDATTSINRGGSAACH